MDAGGYGKSYEIPGTDKINTQQVTMQEVKELYMGPEIKADIVFAEYYVAFGGIFIFSAGLPSLYILGFITYVIQFYSYKFLLLRYYKKTVIFDDKLPTYTVKFFKIAILFHVLFTGYILSSELVNVKKDDTQSGGRLLQENDGKEQQ